MTGTPVSDDDTGGSGGGGGLPAQTLFPGGSYTRIRHRLLGTKNASGSVRLKYVITPASGLQGDIVIHGFEIEGYVVGR